MADPLNLPLSRTEERYLARLKKMYPARAGGEVALVQRLVARARAEEGELVNSANLSAELLAHYRARVERMYGPRDTRQLELWDEPASATASEKGQVERSFAMANAPVAVPEPEWNETPFDDEVDGDTAAVAVWGESTSVELEFPRDAPVVAVTPLEAAERGEYPFEYLVNTDVPKDDPERIVGVAVKYTHEQLRLAMEVVKALTDETEEYVVHWD